MKQVLSVALLFISLSFVYGQEAVKLSRAGAKEEYCMVSAVRKGLFSTKINITVDFGQKVSFWTGTTTTTHGLKDSNGRLIAFNTIIDALNYMASFGWEFVNAYTVKDGETTVYYYIMKRILTEEDKKGD